MAIRTFGDALDPYDYIQGIKDNWLPSIGQDWDNFSSRGYSSTNVMEREAIRRLQQARPTLPKRPATYEEADFERWRALWVDEALHIRKFTEPGSAEDAAAEILVLGSQLRSAIEDNEAEKAAALGALIMCYAIAGGYSIEVEAMRQTQEAINSAKQHRLRSTIGKTHLDLDRARDACIRKAKELWKEDPALRIGQVADSLRAGLLRNLDKFDTLKKETDIPEPETIKAWLKDAAAAKKLTIPEGAQKPGRPPKSSRK